MHSIANLWQGLSRVISWSPHNCWPVAIRRSRDAPINAPRLFLPLLLLLTKLMQRDYLRTVRFIVTGLFACFADRPFLLLLSGRHGHPNDNGTIPAIVGLL